VTALVTVMVVVTGVVVMVVVVAVAVVVVVAEVGMILLRSVSFRRGIHSQNQDR
jgi:hypothetical protein